MKMAEIDAGVRKWEVYISKKKKELEEDSPQSLYRPTVWSIMNEIEYTERTIDCTPSRKATTLMLIEIIKNGSHNGRQWAEGELLRICPEEWD